MSQCAAILNVLADGRPHSMQSIHEKVGFCRLNSRIAELRARGHRIVCDRVGKQYIYTLLGSPLAAPDTLVQSGAGGSGAASGGTGPTPVAAAHYTPLSESEGGQPSWGRPASSAMSERPSDSLSGVGSDVGPDGTGVAQLTLLPEPSRPRERWAA